MAFQQAQQRPQAPRQLSLVQQPSSGQVQAQASPTRKRVLEDSQEWILFSPAPRSDGQTQSYTSQTPRTATHVSDYGSLETHVRSQPIDDDSHNDQGEVTCLGTEVEDDDNAELDSLDDGLHAFHHHPFSSSSHQLDQSGGAVLPTHDGLGMFPSSAGLQEQLWQFERHNPHRRRHVRRRSSVQKKLDLMMEEEGDLDETEDRTARIEKWRLEQSRAVLEEIERETRRRRRRMSRMSGASHATDMELDSQNTVATSAKQRTDSGIATAEEAKAGNNEDDAPEPANESWWQRLTRRVIQDLIGLDETTLSVIFGEQLPEDDPSPTPTQPSPIAIRASQESRVTFQDRGYSWETKLLERIAKELGVLVHQLSEHEGAFSTYMRTRAEPEYAGLPLPEPVHRHTHRRKSTEGAGVATSETLFRPTLQATASSEANDMSLWGIEEEPSRANTTQREPTTLLQQQERDYWERDVDVRMIFDYLKRRFSNATTNNTLPPGSSAQPTGPLPASWITATTANRPTNTSSTTNALGSSPESVRRAEVIRRQHPLVSRAAERAAAAQKSRRRDSFLLLRSVQKRGAASQSSCASQSTKRSRQSRSGSSRHYWDFGGPGSGGSGGVGSGGVAGEAGLGGWGEV